jgi:hypothetical protein
VDSCHGQQEDKRQVPGSAHAVRVWPRAGAAWLVVASPTACKQPKLKVL